MDGHSRARCRRSPSPASGLGRAAFPACVAIPRRPSRCPRARLTPLSISSPQSIRTVPQRLERHARVGWQRSLARFARYHRNKRGMFARSARSNGINGKVCRCRGSVKSKRQPGCGWCARGPPARTRTPIPPRLTAPTLGAHSPDAKAPRPPRFVPAKCQPCSARAR